MGYSLMGPSAAPLPAPPPPSPAVRRRTTTLPLPRRPLQCATACSMQYVPRASGTDGRRGRREGLTLNRHTLRPTIPCATLPCIAPSSSMPLTRRGATVGPMALSLLATLPTMVAPFPVSFSVPMAFHPPSIHTQR